MAENPNYTREVTKSIVCRLVQANKKNHTNHSTDTKPVKDTSFQLSDNQCDLAI